MDVINKELVWSIFQLMTKTVHEIFGGWVLLLTCMAITYVDNI